MTENNKQCTPEIDHEINMLIAIKQAQEAEDRDEVPIGAILIDNDTGEIIAQNGNRTIENNDPTAHAEILCIKEACKKANNQRIPNTTLYVTLEPCTMCAAAISFARIQHVVIGAEDIKGGGVLNGVKFFNSPTCHHKIKITNGILAEKCSEMLKEFFKKKR